MVALDAYLAFVGAVQELSSLEAAQSCVVGKRELAHIMLEDNYKEPEVAVVAFGQPLQLQLLPWWLDYGFARPFVDWGESIVAQEPVDAVHFEETKMGMKYTEINYANWAKVREVVTILASSLFLGYI